MQPVLVLDFDGTVCLGDGPVWAYADEALRGVEDEIADRVRTALRHHLDGSPAAAGAHSYPDGYAAVATLAGPYVSPEDLQKAYTASREALAGGALDIAAPAGLAPFLTDLGGRARRVLVTNAPATGLSEALTTLGLAGVFDDVRTEAGKPDRFPPLLTDLLRGAPPATLMSVGDFWVNDIAPALAAGCATAYLTRDLHDGRPAHLRAHRLPELYPAISAWVTDPASLHAPPDPLPPAAPRDTP